jgi:glycosyltransferase involved in cell wall biosynthesis
MGEALSSGLPVIMTAISPNNQFLPKGWLVPAYKKDQFTPRTVIDIYEADVRELAMKIDKFARMNPRRMLFENQRANALAESISWTTMLPQYKEFFGEVVNQPKSQ